MNKIFIFTSWLIANHALSQNIFPSAFEIDWSKYSLEDLFGKFKTTTGFVDPNEHNIIEFTRHIEPSQGIYVSVGSERAYLGALANHAEHIIAIDMDPKIGIFHAINLELLKNASDREHYNFLRFEASSVDWAELVDHRGFLAQEKTHEAWKILHRELDIPTAVRDSGFYKLKTAANGFAGVNYVAEDAAFAHLQSMAKAGHIEFQLLDLNDSSAVERFVKYIIDHTPLRIGVLDLSNTASTQYFGLEGAINIYKQFLGAMKDSSRVMFTGPWKGQGDWSYMFMEYDLLKSFDTNQIKQIILDNVKRLEWLEPKLSCLNFGVFGALPCKEFFEKLRARVKISVRRIPHNRCGGLMSHLLSPLKK